jgi:hypothetical protein
LTTGAPSRRLRVQCAGDVEAGVNFEALLEAIEREQARRGNLQPVPAAQVWESKPSGLGWANTTRTIGWPASCSTDMLPANGTS